MAKLRKDVQTTYIKRYFAGIETFRKLFIHWMDTNRWSHPVMIRLATKALEGSTWLHSSQISAIRAGTLLNPGPRTFVAVAELNKAMHLYSTTKKLIPDTTSDVDYLQGYAITVDGEAPGPEWWYGVFVGYTVPDQVPYQQMFCDDAAAERFSIQFAKYLRRLLAAAGYDIFTDLNVAIYRLYPAGDAERVDKLREVLLNVGTWSAKEAEVELSALAAMTSELDGVTTATELLEELR